MKRPLAFTPPTDLQEFIASYGILEIPDGQTETYFSPPLAMSGFIINIGKNKGTVIARIEDRDFFTANAVAGGQVTAPVYGELVGEVKSIMVFFKAMGMHRFFGNDLSQLTNSSKALTEFLGPEEADLLWNNLKAQPDNQQQINILNDFFRKHITHREEDKKLEKVLDYIHEKQGNVNITEILESFYYPRKSLERHFRKKIGLSPKVYIKIYRFKCLINFLEHNPETTWSQLASQTGYFDQSHMSRYVKEYLKVSPNSIVTLDMDYINYLLNR
ncbi:helix-turn-helix domain-containing protein [Gramella jeungdoensis]|uniref:Helix-turn-helix domain-containing protein n=1 Tax=Gramella jeungdoensis TaxID=708091 RepID=A0ABT0Z0K3_9FLAO|nr:helix-turn-helix domain-containing protein [Gramella jeungdoensis]MCM8568915.1 helix-turn-helix domain-containing protein [Gramella jeungdoensis]